MTLQTDGTITFADINIELGRASTTQMSLNDADVRALAGVPSGQISIDDFYGKSAKSIVAPANRISAAIVTAGNPKRAGIRLVNSGQIEIYQGGTINNANTVPYVSPLSAAGDVDIIVTATTGSPLGVALNTSLSLATTREIYIEDDDFSTFVGDVEFYLDGVLEHTMGLIFELERLI